MDASASQPCAPRGSGPTDRILVVDPDAELLEGMVHALSALGQVEFATSAEEGWALIQIGDPHLVIADQHLPGVPGLELLKRAGERDPHVGRILLTHYGDTQMTLEAIDHGRVDAYLPKPSLPTQLRMTVRSVLERAKLERENAELVRDLREKNRALHGAMISLRAAQKRVVDSERLGAIGRMAAMIVHDFRAPLSVIRSAGASLLRGGESAAERTELAQQIGEESERMTRMCSELLEVTRVSGTLSPTRESVDDLVDTAFALLAEDAGRAGVEIYTDLRSHATMMLDADRFRRVLLNLGYNAIEAMVEHGGALRVSSEVEGSEVVVTVADQGPGIPDGIRQRLFDPFVTHGKPGGSGLGLAVVKKVVEDHGGTVSVEKAEGGGSAFRIRLPRYLQQAAPEVA